jgi:GT2 family glycosyltransferase/glycosyltransferase involved in cell wall biosynthesis
METTEEERFTHWLGGFPLEAPVVVVPVFNAYDDVLECVDSLLASTPEDTPILILDDASTDRRIADTLGPLSSSRGFAYVVKPSNSGFVGTVNVAFEWCAPRDVVVVNSDVVVPPGWLERLRSAAYARSTIATATPLTNNGTILSVPHRNKPTPHLIEGMTTAEIDACIRKASLLLRPIIPVAVGHCMYVKRSVLDRVGFFDEAFSPGYGEEVDFSQRAVMAGFSHVAADDLFLYHKGSRSFDAKGEEERKQLQASHEKTIKVRYPWYHPWADRSKSDPCSPLALALETARASLLGHRIAIDATGASGKMTGTQVLILELIRALATHPGRHAYVAMIVGDRTPAEALLGVDDLVDDVFRRSDLQDLEDPTFDLVHRPCQVRSVEELTFLQKVAHRFIISQLDCISYSNPSYAETFDEWMHHRLVTELTHAMADGIIYISHEAAQDAAHQGLQVPAERTCISSIGVDHQLGSAEPKAPQGSDEFGGRPFILVLGTNFRHKNRVYALRLLGVLVAEYEWSGRLVFAGPTVSGSGSAAEEAEAFEKGPEIRAHVCDIGAVSEREKRWLLQRAALVLYPTIYEGFGLVPFEAAIAGTPSLTTRATSLGEVLGEKVTYLSTLDPAAGAEVAWSMLSDPAVARSQVEAIRERALAFQWQQAAGRTWDFYQRILRMPCRSPGFGVLLDPDQTRFVWGPQSRSWVKRVARAFRILRNEGSSALLAETQQFVRWLRA